MGEHHRTLYNCLKMTLDLGNTKADSVIAKNENSDDKFGLVNVRKYLRSLKKKKNTPDKLDKCATRVKSPVSKLLRKFRISKNEKKNVLDKSTASTSEKNEDVSLDEDEATLDEAEADFEELVGMFDESFDDAEADFDELVKRELFERLI